MMQTLLSTFRPPDRRTTALVLTLALIAAVTVWYFGADVWHAILLGAVATVIGLTFKGVSGETEARALGWGTAAGSTRSGGREDIRELSESMQSSWGYVGWPAEFRLRQTAQRRLSLEGLDLRHPEHRAQIERRIGAPAYEILTREKSRGLRLNTLTACLDLLDALEPMYYPAPRPSMPRRTLKLNPSRPRGHRDG